MRQRHLFFDAEEFWKDKPYKAWVVHLEGKNRRAGKKDSMCLNITAKTPESAIATAKRHCALLVGKVEGSARLATPPDLGARWVPQK